MTKSKPVTLSSFAVEKRVLPTLGESQELKSGETVSLTGHTGCAMMESMNESKVGTARHVRSRLDVDRVARTPHTSVLFIFPSFFGHASWQWRIRVVSAAVSGTRPLACPLELDQAQALGESIAEYGIVLIADIEARDVAEAKQVPDV